MSLNERIKKIRKDFDLTQKEFGARIGLKGNSIALIEGGRPTSDQTVYAICRTFNVSETWLRTGEGEMYGNKGPDVLGDYLKERGVTELEEKIIRAWMELPAKDRRELLEHFQRRLAQGETLSTPKERVCHFPQDMTLEEMQAELARQYAEEKKPEDVSSASGRGNSSTAIA